MSLKSILLLSIPLILLVCLGAELAVESIQQHRSTKSIMTNNDEAKVPDDVIVIGVAGGSGAGKVRAQHLHFVLLTPSTVRTVLDVFPSPCMLV